MATYSVRCPAPPLPICIRIAYSGRGELSNERSSYSEVNDDTTNCHFNRAHNCLFIIPSITTQSYIPLGEYFHVFLRDSFDRFDVGESAHPPQQKTAVLPVGETRAKYRVLGIHLDPMTCKEMPHAPSQSVSTAQNFIPRVEMSPGALNYTW